MTYYTYAFEKLEIWQLGRALKKRMYQISASFPKHELYGLSSQLRRSAASITANIAEGSGRATQADRAYFLNMAYASGLEVLDHLTTAYDLEYIAEEEYGSVRIELDKLLNKLNAFYKYTINAKESLKSKMKKT